MKRPYKLIESRNGTGANTSNRYGKVVLDTGEAYSVAVERGGFARGMYGVRGSKWYGRVTRPDGRTVWSGRVEKSTGFHSLLIWSGVIPCKHEKAGVADGVYLYQCRACAARPEGPAVARDWWPSSRRVS